MKKMFVLLLALSLTFMMVLPASAATSTENNIPSNPNAPVYRPEDFDYQRAYQSDAAKMAQSQALTALQPEHTRASSSWYTLQSTYTMVGQLYSNYCVPASVRSILGYNNGGLSSAPSQSTIASALGTGAPMALEELYPDDKEEQIKGLKRHMQFFITENMIGGIIPGIITSLEEQRAIQKRDQVPEDQLISEDLINSVKNGMMGPFAGVGDTLNYATLKPLISTFFMGFAQQGMLWAPIVDDILLYVILVSEGKFMFNMGYKLGTDSAMNILQNNAVQKIVTFFSIVGLFVMGTMAAQNVNVAVIYEIPYGAKDMISIQELLFNPIAPGILSLLAVFGVYAYLKKGGTVLKVTLVLLVIAIALGGLGILGV